MTIIHDHADTKVRAYLIWSLEKHLSWYKCYRYNITM